MHELFTSGAVPHSQLEEILEIVQGLCAMTPVRHLERRLVFEGPKAPPLLGVRGAQLQKQNPNNIPLWKELHEQLVRQSYYITISYDIDDAQFGKLVSDEHEGTVAANLEDQRGNLQFFDNPDPPGTRSVNSRLAIQIRDEPHLPDILGQIKYNYSSEHVREAYYAYRENVIFCLSRDLQRPKPTDGVVASDLSHVTQGDLPAFEEFRPFDGENKWTLTISAQVSDGNQPALMQKGLDQLAQVKHDMAGTIEFIMAPRHQLDTRVLSYNLNMRGLLRGTVLGALNKSLTNIDATTLLSLK